MKGRKQIWVVLEIDEFQEENPRACGAFLSRGAAQKRAENRQWKSGRDCIVVTTYLRGVRAHRKDPGADPTGCGGFRNIGAYIDQDT